MDTKDSGGGMAGMMAGGGMAGLAQSMGISLPGLGSSAIEVFSSMLKSREMMDAIIREFKLVQVYEVDTVSDAREILEGRTKIALTKDKAIKVTVEDHDPKRAADLANFFVTRLDQMNQEYDVTKASANRKFVERRLVEARLSLAKAEEDMLKFQTQNKTVAIDAQATAMIQAAATIQAQITAQEVQLQVMETYLAPDNPEVYRVRSGLAELKNQLRNMHSGKKDKGIPLGDQLHPAFTTVPGLALEYGRLIREVKVQDMVYTLLVTQLEQARLAEARDTPTVQVLDHAVPAERKSRPKVVLNTLIAGIVGWFISLVVAFWKEYVERTQMKRGRKSQEPVIAAQAA
jgi:uncharacterized protein involved in exopolysaccharide biosynthesis